MSLPPYDAWALRRRLCGEPILNGELDAMSDKWRPLAERLAATPLDDRQEGLDWFLMGRSVDDQNAIVLTMAQFDPKGPPPPIDPPRQFATCADVLKLETGVPWTWKGWLPSARVVGIAAGEGVGKTRFAMDLARRVWHGKEWPDGQVMTLPAKSPTLWIAADGQQSELASSLASMNMPPEAIIFPTPPDDPYGGNSLDDDETLKALDEAARIHKPAFVVIDSLTYATKFDLSEQRIIAMLKGPLVALAQTHQVIVMLLLHVSKEGVALGRRIQGITRSLIHLECPDPDHHPERLRLWVQKSYAKKPEAWGVTIGEPGNTYDSTPPARIDRSKGGRPPVKLDKAIAFLEEKLTVDDRKGCELIDEWLALGEPSKNPIFDAKKRMEVDGRLVVDDSKRPQIWHLVKTQSQTV
jgi:AAA domain